MRLHVQMFGSCVAPTQPVTELEREIAAVLEGSENVKEAEGEGEGLSEAEQKALLRMSLEEVCACLVSVLATQLAVTSGLVCVCVLRRVADASLPLYSVECMW